MFIPFILSIGHYIVQCNPTVDLLPGKDPAFNTGKHTVMNVMLELLRAHPHLQLIQAGITSNIFNSDLHHL